LRTSSTSREGRVAAASFAGIPRDHDLSIRGHVLGKDVPLGRAARHSQARFLLGLAPLSPWLADSGPSVRSSLDPSAEFAGRLTGKTLRRRQRSNRPPILDAISTGTTTMHKKGGSPRLLGYVRRYLADRPGLIASAASERKRTVVALLTPGLGIRALLLLAVVPVDPPRTWQESLPEGAPNHFLVII
jgi:hypothetical protein